MAFGFKYGKLPHQGHPKTLRLSKYMGAGVLPPEELKRAWEYVIQDGKWGMLGNDEVGNCLEATMLHYLDMVTAWTSGAPAGFETQDAIDLYTAITGYNPADPSTDQGTVYTQALAYWQSTGIKGHKILGWAEIDYNELGTLHQAISIFGAALIGFNVPQSAETQFDAGEPWNVVEPDGGSVGGHAVPIVGFGAEGQTCITWGQRQQMDLKYPATYFDESYVVITEEWLTAAQKTPIKGFDLSTLESDLKLIAA